jgi:hypothetical protein
LFEKVKTCGNCANVSFAFTEADIMLLTRMASRYKTKVFKRWQDGHVRRPGSKRALDPDKVRAAELSRVRIHCPVEKTMVSYVDSGCAHLKPREREAAP